MKTFSFIIILILHFDLYAQSKYELAADHYDRALENYRNNSFGLARDHIDLAIKYQATSENYYLSGLIFEAENKPLRAVAEYEATVRYNERFLEAYFQKALIYLAYNDPEQALADFNYLILNAVSADTRSVYFQIDPKGSQQNAIVTLANLNARLYNYRGQAYQKLGNYEAAQKDYSKAIEIQPHPDFYVNRGLLAQLQGNPEEAKKDFKEAINLQLDHQLAWYNLVLIDAETELPESFMDEEQFNPTTNLLAARALEKKDYRQALQYYNQVLTLSEDGLSLINRGRVLTNLKEYSAARSDFARAQYLEPHRLEAFYLIGNTYFYQKQFENALAYYNQYLAVDPLHAMTWYNAAMAYLELDKAEEACLCLSRAKYLGMTEAEEIMTKYCE